MGQTERKHLIDNFGSKASHITMGSFASRPANTFTLLLSTDAPYDSSNKENFIEPEHDVVDSVSTSDTTSDTQDIALDWAAQRRTASRRPHHALDHELSQCDSASGTDLD